MWGQCFQVCLWGKKLTWCHADADLYPIRIMFLSAELTKPFIPCNVYLVRLTVLWLDTVLSCNQFCNTGSPPVFPWSDAPVKAPVGQPWQSPAPQFHFRQRPYLPNHPVLRLSLPQWSQNPPVLSMQCGSFKVGEKWGEAQGSATWQTAGHKWSLASRELHSDTRGTASSVHGGQSKSKNKHTFLYQWVRNSWKMLLLAS